MGSRFFSVGGLAAKAAAGWLVSWVFAFSGAMAADEPLSVVATNYPLAYFAARLADESASVVLPVPKGQDPADWQPSLEAIATLQDADMILLNGVDYAAWTRTVALPRSRLVDTTRRFADAFIPYEGAVHAHGPQGAHSHGAVATHVWLDFSLATAQAETIAGALARKLPAAADAIDRRLSALRADLAALDAAARQLGEAARGVEFLMSHPVYQYFTRAYGLDAQSLHWEPHVAPGDEDWAAFDAKINPDRRTVMVWEGEPLAETAATLASRGIDFVVFDTASNRGDVDFVATMTANLARLAEAIAEE